MQVPTPNVTGTGAMELHRSAILLAALLFAGPSSVSAHEHTVPAEAGWIVNTDGARSGRMVVRTPEGPPPGIALPPGVAPPPPVAAGPADGVGEAAHVNVLGVTVEDRVTWITTQFIPDYAVTMTPALKESLARRPRFASDFPHGIAVKPGAAIGFGDDIGYAGDTCAAGHGRGYWPPGTFCAAANVTDIDLPNRPRPGEAACYTALATVGVFLNGVGLFNWSDAQTYRNEGVWHNTAMTFEVYDTDICDGHAAEGIYHHHGYSQCLADRLGDRGQGHSPVWGYAADGYPIHGPWHAAGVRARSCWKPRDYAAGSPTGCGRDRVRDCVLVDNRDPAKGTRKVAAAPDVGSTAQRSLFSDNPVSMAVGAFYEDFYYEAACTAADSAGLDEHNGHDHDGLGYHYHLTVDAGMRPVFPYSVGPAYYGHVGDTTVTSCGANPFGFADRRAGRRSAVAKP